MSNIQLSGRCMKCKTDREMKDVEIIEMKPGRPAARGKCSVCGTGMYKILSKDKAAELQSQSEMKEAA